MQRKSGAKARQEFGGTWTERKLKVVGNYLQAYTVALKNQSFEKWYIDAFAGTGYRDKRRGRRASETQGELIFPDLAGEEPHTFLAGSAALALHTQPPFDRYLYIEQDEKFCRELEGLKKSCHAHLQERISIVPGNANTEIQRLCKEPWHDRRAVLFLDPYGMQVEWSTITAIAETRAIDLWILFPLGMGVNRLLTRSGEIPDGWRRRLDLLLGTDDWYDEFYRVERQKDLFGDPVESIVKAATSTIGRYFNHRLGSIFPGVAPEPAVLRNSTNNPMYLLCFAVGNPKAKNIALRIAGSLLKGVH